MSARMVTVNEVLGGHVALDLECLDRVYLNAYVPILQSSGQVVAFMTQYLGLPIPSPALFDKIGQKFRRSVASFAEANHIPWVKFSKDARKAEVLRRCSGRAARRGARVLTGIGLAVYVEITSAAAPTEYGAVHLLHDGRIKVLTGATPYGQGHVTTWKMIIADQLGVPMDAVDVVHGDTDEVPVGGLTVGSRSVQVAGSSLVIAAGKLADAARERAANLLEAAVDDVVLDAAAGTFHVVGSPVPAVGWAEVARAEGEPLVGISDFKAAQPTFPFGAHIAVVDVDTETGKVVVQRVIAVDDAGTLLNPLIVDGQIHGGIGQGVAQALLEWMQYDEDGNPVTSNFADYPLISSAELPSFELVHMETPTWVNPLGAKGAGESGTIGSIPAVLNAVVDALAPLGVRHLDGPTTPERVWEAIEVRPTLGFKDSTTGGHMALTESNTESSLCSSVTRRRRSRSWRREFKPSSACDRPDACRSRQGLEHSGVHFRLPRLTAGRIRPRAAEPTEAARRAQHRSCPGPQRGARGHLGFGSQVAQTYDRPKYEGVAAVWYGKSPGLDRAGDAIRHGSFGGTAARVASSCWLATTPQRSRRRSPREAIRPCRPAPAGLVSGHGARGARSRFPCVCHVAAHRVVGGDEDHDAGRRRLWHRRSGPDSFDPVLPTFEVDGKPWTPTLSGHVGVPFANTLEIEVLGNRIEWAKRYVAANPVNRFITNPATHGWASSPAVTTWSRCSRHCACSASSTSAGRTRQSVS